MPLRKAKVTFKKPSSLGALARTLWEGPTVSATLLVGANKGKQPYSKTGQCRTAPKKFSQKQLDEHVMGLRWFQLISAGLTPAQAKANLAASRTQQRGWYKGAPESSASYLFVHNDDIPGERTRERFKANMKVLSEVVGAALCQDEVIVVFQDPSGNSAAGIVPDGPNERRSAAAFAASRKRRK